MAKLTLLQQFSLPVAFSVVAACGIQEEQGMIVALIEWRGLVQQQSKDEKLYQCRQSFLCISVVFSSAKTAPSIPPCATVFSVTGPGAETMTGADGSFVPMGLET